MVKSNKKETVKDTPWLKGSEIERRRGKSKRDLSKETLTPKRLMETDNVWNYSEKDMKRNKKMGASRSNSTSTSTVNNKSAKKPYAKKRSNKK